MLFSDLVPAVMAMWSKVLPPTASCFSFMSGACEKVDSDLELDGGFQRAVQFPPTVITG